MRHPTMPLAPLMAALLIFPFAARAQSAQGEAPPPTESADPAPGEDEGAEPAEESAQSAEDAEASEQDEVDRKIDVLAAEIERLRLGEVAPTATVSRYGLGPAASKVYESEKGVSLGGYGELLYAKTFGDDGEAEIDFYRNILYAGYKFSDRFVLNTEIEIEHVSEVFLEFAYLDFLWMPQVNLRAGLVLLPMGIINELHEPTTFLGALRPETERRIIPSTWRENGFGAFGDLGDFRYRAYLVNGFDAAGFDAAGLRGGRQKGMEALANDWGGVARVDWIGVEGLLVGASVYYGGADQGQYDFDVSTLIYEAHADLDWRGLKLRGLFARATVSDVADLNEALGFTGGASIGEAMQGWYLQGGYDVLSRLDAGDLSLIPYVRYEQVDTQVEVPVGFDVDPATDDDILTLGASFYPISQIVLKAEYQRTSDAAGNDEDAANVLLGYIF